MSQLPEKTQSEQKPADDSLNNGDQSALLLVSQISGYTIHFTIEPQEKYEVLYKTLQNTPAKLGTIVHQGPPHYSQDCIEINWSDKDPLIIYRTAETQLLSYDELVEAIRRLEARHHYQAQLEEVNRILDR